MAIVEQKFVYRDGANVASAPITSFKLADLFTDLTTGIEGDLAYAKDTDKIYKYTTTWVEVGPVYTPPANVALETTGTWTPIIGGSTSQSGQTYVNQTGRWTRVGRMCYCSCTVQLSAKGTISGNVVIKGLPFSAAGVSYSANIGYYKLNTVLSSVTGFTIPGNSQLYLYCVPAAGSNTSVAMVTGDIFNSTELYFSMAYEV